MVSLFGTRMERRPERPVSEEPDYTFGRISAIVFCLVVMLISAGIALGGLAGPAGGIASQTAVGEVPDAGEAALAPTATPHVEFGPSTRTVVTLYIGPSTDYEVIGLLPAGFALQVVGRDPSGEWIAVAIAPGSGLYGWMPASQARNLPSIETLKVAPVTLLPSNTRR